LAASSDLKTQQNEKTVIKSISATALLPFAARPKTKAALCGPNSAGRCIVVDSASQSGLLIEVYDLSAGGWVAIGFERAEKRLHAMAQMRL